MLGAARELGGSLWYCGQEHTDWERTADGRWLMIGQEEVPRKPYGPAEALDLRGPDANSMVHSEAAWHRAGGWDERCAWLSTPFHR